MADDDSVKLQSGDNEVFSVSKEVACQAVTIKEILEGPSAPPLLPSPVFGASSGRSAANLGAGHRSLEATPLPLGGLRIVRVE